MSDSITRVSAILPCFNCERTLEAALASALEQTLPGVEIVAVDDGSADRTGAILARHAERTPDRVRVLRQDRAGPYAARNLAARHARGEYLAFLDSDDTWHPSKLERQVALMDARPDVVLCHTGILAVRSDGTGETRRAPDPAFRGHCFPRLLVSNGVNTSSVMIRRALFEKLGGFDEAFPARGDWEMWTRIARHGELDLIPDPLMTLLHHPDRMSLDTDRMRRYHLAVIEKNRKLYRGSVADLPRLIAEARRAAHLQYASDYLRAGRSSRALNEGLHALRRGPGSERAWKTVAKSLVAMAHALLARCGVVGPGRLDRPSPARGSRPHVSRGLNDTFSRSGTNQP